ncbi:histidinol phosphatase-like PHP family hydrolase [Spirochaeta isovalerica]|uniref:Histidinol phosphatase-like PHP family hydrolase n=2 Tax=Spirochaeta isovalerica TaxID=150 RepID=A0A841RD26_9SPIO|nr:histidinol phosphatase-like PHP family hydrolase [Spirochaeta isovalerica]
MENQYKQDLHIHTVYSTGDSSVEPQQTIPFIAELDHAEVRGISDHFEYLTGQVFEEYRKEVHDFGFWCGCEVNDSIDAREAAAYPFDYYIYHCRDRVSEYKGAETLLETGKPVIVSHPMAMGADLNKVPTDCLLEINNRYVWKNDYMSYFSPHLHRFRFTIGSDAHKPNWLSQNVARHAAAKLGIEETVLFPLRFYQPVHS